MSIELVLGLDLETTGLDEESDFILECVAKVVAPDFSIKNEARWVLTCSEEELDIRLTPAVRAQHEKSGLLEEVRQSSICIEELDNGLSTFIKHHWGDAGKPLLLGNSIHFDRRFIRHDLPITEKLLHYRMIDVSAIREALRIFGSKHRAFEDVDASISELKLFIGRLK